MYAAATSDLSPNQPGPKPKLADKGTSSRTEKNREIHDASTNQKDPGTKPVDELIDLDNDGNRRRAKTTNETHTYTGPDPTTGQVRNSR